MATIKFIVRAEKRKLVPVYVRLSAGRKKSFMVKSGQMVDPKKWSNSLEKLKTRTPDANDTAFNTEIDKIRTHIQTALNSYHGEISKQWLTNVVNLYYNITADTAVTLNAYIAGFIKDAKSGAKKGKASTNFAPGTVKAWEGFQQVFLEYQGQYTPKRLEKLLKAKKTPRERVTIDYKDITLSFADDFKAYLSDAGYKPNTIWRFFKELKFFMQRSLDYGKHENRHFQNKGKFSSEREEAFSIYLTAEEVDKIYSLDLSGRPELDIARDAFIVLCETALRISDYSKVDLNVRERNGKKFIHIQQQKTGGRVIIPLTYRMQEILAKYGGSLPQLHDVLINRRIKIVAKEAGLTEKLRWEAVLYGKKYTKTKFKWELVTCHSGRRTACTLMYLAGIPVLDIMKISGHSSQRIFQDYVKVTEEETADRMADHPHFNRAPLKIAQ